MESYLSYTIMVFCPIETIRMFVQRSIFWEQPGTLLSQELEQFPVYTLKNDTCVVIMEQISQILRSFLKLFNLQVHRMDNLVFNHLNSKFVLKLKNAPRTPLINLIFTSYQKEQIAYNWYTNWVVDSMPVLLTWCSPNPKPLWALWKLLLQTIFFDKWKSLLLLHQVDWLRWFWFYLALHYAIFC